MRRGGPVRSTGLRSACLLGALLLVLTACTSTSPDRPHEEELPKVKIAVTKAIDTVPLRIAYERGLFQNAGLDVELAEMDSERAAMAALAAGDVAVAFAGNLRLLRAAAAGTDVQFQAEAYISGEKTMALVGLPGDASGDEAALGDTPVIGIEPDNQLGRLSTRSRLSLQGVDTQRIRFTDLGFDDMATRLQDASIDAAWLTEPDISRAQKELGAEIVADTGVGSMLHFPLSSYAARESAVARHPRTFQRLRELISQAQEVATDPSVVRRAMSTFRWLDKTTATLVAVGTFPTSLNAVRLQRVADLMHKAELVDERIDVESLMPGRG